MLYSTKGFSQNQTWQGINRQDIDKALTLMDNIHEHLLDPLFVDKETTRDNLLELQTLCGKIAIDINNQIEPLMICMNYEPNIKNCIKSSAQPDGVIFNETYWNKFNGFIIYNQITIQKTPEDTLEKKQVAFGEIEDFFAVAELFTVEAIDGYFLQGSKLPNQPDGVIFKKTFEKQINGFIVYAQVVIQKTPGNTFEKKQVTPEELRRCLFKVIELFTMQAINDYLSRCSNLPNKESYSLLNMESVKKFSVFLTKKEPPDGGGKEKFMMIVSKNYSTNGLWTSNAPDIDRNLIDEMLSVMDCVHEHLLDPVGFTDKNYTLNNVLRLQELCLQVADNIEEHIKKCPE